MEEQMQHDDRLWFEHLGCEGKHFLIGNPHTFPGRMFGWCPKKQRTFFVSKEEIGDCSVEAKYWIMGFLSGNQPKPPVNEEGDVDFKSEQYLAWVKKIGDFEKSGYWDLE